MGDTRRRLAIMFTDIQGFSAMMAADEPTTVRVVREHRLIVRSALAAFGGREIRTIGDAFLILFDTAADAVRCGLRIQEELTARNRAVAAAEQVRLRVGIHLGDVLVGEEGELYGDAINVAARLEPLAPVGGLCVSEPVVAETGDLGKPEPMGKVALKNISDPPALFAIRVDPEAAAPRKAATNLPAERPLVGRAGEIADLRGRLRAGARLVTVLGPGGTGKTTVLTRLGHEEVGRWPGGVWFCGLAEATDRDGVVAVVASALGLPPNADPGAALGARAPTLLLLDNAEQVVGPLRELVAGWLDRAPEVAMVVTSRERLGVAVEQVFGLDALPEADAVRLFVERARAVRSDWTAGPEEEAAVAELVRRLDGMPLAIEICAARVRMEPPTALLRRLPGRLDLRASRRDGPARQVTLRSTIAWSWSMLSEEERRGMASLSVFAGPFDLDAAEAVLDAPDPLAVIESLVDKSLLRGGDELRWYDTLRAFAAEQLSPEEAAAARDRHAAFFAGWAGEASSESLKARYDNVLAAVEHAAARGHHDVAARAWVPLAKTSYTQGPWRPVLAAGRKIGEPEAPSLAVELHVAVSRLSSDTADYFYAIERARRALALARTPLERATAWLHLARPGASVLPSAEAEAACDAALAEGPLPEALALWLRVIRSVVVYSADPERAKVTSDALVMDAERAGSPLAFTARHNRAVWAIGDGRLDDAEKDVQRNLEELRRGVGAQLIAPAWLVRAYLDNLRGHWELGRGAALRGVNQAASVGNTKFETSCTAALAVAEAGLGDEAAFRRAAARCLELASNGDHSETSQAHGLVAWGAAVLGDRAMAEAHIARAEAIAREGNVHPGTIFARWSVIARERLAQSAAGSWP